MPPLLAQGTRASNLSLQATLPQTAAPHSLSSHPAPPPVWILTDDGGHVASTYGAPAEGSLFCLIGKDGTIKQCGPAIPAPGELFKTVDAIPTRRQERRERDGEGRG